MQLDGKVALVTGAGKGIGRELAPYLARAGATVALHYHESSEGAAAAADEIRALNGAVGLFQADLGAKGDIDRMVAEVTEAFGRIDILVNNAAWDPGRSPFFEIDEAFYDRVLAINLKGVFFCTQAVARGMVDRGEGGRIINISSIHAKLTVANRSIYGTAKGGLEALTRSLAWDLGAHRITVNAIAPGYIEVDRTRNQTNPERLQKFLDATPLASVGQPADVAALTAFLASDEAAWITGQVYGVDGGLSVTLI